MAMPTIMGWTTMSSPNSGAMEFDWDRENTLWKNYMVIDWFLQLKA